MSRRRAGMTLIEVTVVMFSVSVLATALLWLLLSGKALWLSTMDQAAVNQELHVAAYRMAREMEDSQAATAVVRTEEPLAVCFRSAWGDDSAFHTDAQGDPVWQRWVAYYLPEGSTRLLRLEITGDVETEMSEAELLSYLGDGAGSRLSDCLADLEASIDPDTGQARLVLVGRRTNTRGKLDEQTVAVEVLMRN